jgi:hypothetical protein
VPAASEEKSFETEETPVLFLFFLLSFFYLHDVNLEAIIIFVSYGREGKSKTRRKK